MVSCKRQAVDWNNLESVPRLLGFVMHLECMHPEPLCLWLLSSRELSSVAPKEAEAGTPVAMTVMLCEELEKAYCRGQTEDYRTNKRSEKMKAEELHIHMKMELYKV